MPYGPLFGSPSANPPHHLHPNPLHPTPPPSFSQNSQAFSQGSLYGNLSQASHSQLPLPPLQSPYYSPSLQSRAYAPPQPYQPPPTSYSLYSNLDGSYYSPSSAATSSQQRCVSSGSSDGELDLSKPHMSLLKSSLAYCGFADLDDMPRDESIRPNNTNNNISVPGASNPQTNNNNIKNTPATSAFATKPKTPISTFVPASGADKDDCDCSCHLDEAAFRLQLYMTATAGTDAGYFYSRLPFRPYFDLTTPLKDYIYRDEHIPATCLNNKCCSRANMEPVPAAAPAPPSKPAADSDLIDTCLVSGGQMPEKLSFETKNVVAWFRKMKRAVFSQEKYGGLTKNQLYRFLLKSVKYELRLFVSQAMIADHADWHDPISWSQYLLEITYDRFKLRLDLRSLVIDLHKTPTNDMECRRYARLHADYQAYYHTAEGYYNILMSNFDGIATAKIENELKNEKYMVKNRLIPDLSLDAVKNALNDAIIKLYTPKTLALDLPAKAPPTPPTPSMALSRDASSLEKQMHKRVAVRSPSAETAAPSTPPTKASTSLYTTPFSSRTSIIKKSGHDVYGSPAMSPTDASFFSSLGNIEMGQLSQVTLAEVVTKHGAASKEPLTYAAVAASTISSKPSPALLTPNKSSGSMTIFDNDDDDEVVVVDEEEEEEIVFLMRANRALGYSSAHLASPTKEAGSIGSERKAGLLGGTFTRLEKPMSLAPLPLSFIGASSPSPSARRHHSMTLGKIGDEGVPSMRRASFTEEVMLAAGDGVAVPGSGLLSARTPPSEKTWTGYRFMVTTNELFCAVDGVPMRTHVAFRHPLRRKRGQSIITREESLYRTKHKLCIRCGNHIEEAGDEAADESSAKCVRHPYYYIYFNWEL